MEKLPSIVVRSVVFTLTGATFAFGLASVPESRADSREKPAITFNRDVAPIIFNHCSNCHRPGQGAPFSLLSYKDVQKHGKLIAEVTKAHAMPPWKVGPGDCAFRDDIHLSDTQITVLQEWVAGGMPEGAPKDLPILPKFTDGWSLGKPDLIVKMPAAYPVPAEGPDIYRNFVIPVNLPDDVYISAVDFRPSARSVVHHSLFFYDSTGSAKKRDGEDGKPGYGGAMGGAFGGGQGGFQRFRSGSGGGIPSFGSLGGWAVGAQPVAMPDGLAYPLPKGGDLILSTHFHPTGKSEQEESTVGLYFTKTPPKQQFMTLQFPPVFGALSGLKIPAGEKDYRIEDTYTLPVGVKAFGVAGHAHYLAKEMKLTATLPDGKTKTLFWIPDWDFNWQGQYMYQEFVDLPKGTVLKAYVKYDNSSENPHQPSSPPKQVNWGEQTTDEMGSVILRLIPGDPSDLPVLEKDYRGHLRDAFMKHPFRPRQALR